MINLIKQLAGFQRPLPPFEDGKDAATYALFTIYDAERSVRFSELALKMRDYDRQRAMAALEALCSAGAATVSGPAHDRAFRFKGKGTRYDYLPLIPHTVTTHQ